MLAHTPGHSQGAVYEAGTPQSHEMALSNDALATGYWEHCKATSKWWGGRSAVYGTARFRKREGNGKSA